MGMELFKAAGYAVFLILRILQEKRKGEKGKRKRKASHHKDLLGNEET